MIKVAVRSRRGFTREVSWVNTLSREVLTITDDEIGFVDLISLLNIVLRLFPGYTAKKSLWEPVEYCITLYECLQACMGVLGNVVGSPRTTAIGEQN